ncbi:MAG: type II toxin-antitoxin system RelE/ParE family toxin [Phormidesmis sp. RL_2_1]|nr:type II toxin-antitoxin system RelE/ParE family toxin [Phormidesmis sp. RL_2_1]
MPPSPPYIARLTQEAKRDLAEIRTYTIQQFGRDQWPVYQQRIEAAIQKLCQNASAGSRCVLPSSRIESFSYWSAKGLSLSLLPFDRTASSAR